MTSARRRPGRPPDLEKRRAIITATLEILAEVGYASLTIDAVAQRAGSNRVLIYRVWDTKPALVADALFGTAEDLSIADTGSVTEDLRDHISQLVTTMARPAYLNGVTGLTVDMLRDPAGWADIHDRYIRPAEDAVELILRRASERGQVTDHLDARTITYIISGSITSLAQGRGMSGTRLVDTVLAAVVGGVVTIDR